MAFRSLFLSLLCSLSAVNAVTVYSQLPLGAATPTSTGTGTAAAAEYTGSAAYDPTMLQPPEIPQPPPGTQFPIFLWPTADTAPGISISAPSSFFGISIEMSVATQVIGKTASFLNVPFLNLMSLLAERAGQVVVRVGGNTQDYATLVDSTSDGRVIEKQGIDPNNPTATPTLIYTDELLWMLRNVSSLVNVKWFLGVPFNDTIDIHMQIVEHGEAILGDTLLGFQVGNEPDLYEAHKHRVNYTPTSYYQEFGLWRDAWENDAGVPVKNNMIGPSLSLADWTLEDIWNTPFLTDYHDNLFALSVEHYPADNCAAIYPTPGNPIVDPQQEFPNYLTHNSGISIVHSMLNSTMIAQQVGKPFIMFETNSASCGGFRGISNSFGSALWALDYGLQMVYSNFTHALVHVGGQNVFYNPFTPPPTNQSAFHQWTIGPIFYSLLIMPEILGKSNTSRVVDLWPNNSSELTPAYAIYENNQLARVALFNYMTDPTGAFAYNATITIGGGQTGAPQSAPASVRVKYLLADSVSQLFNMTWAGQTFGDKFSSDGRLVGDEDIKTVQCDPTNGCVINVPAPGFALVLMNDDAAQGSEPAATQTFSTTALTKTVNTATLPSGVLETSNGHSGKDRLQGGSTSRGSSGAGRAAGIAPSVAILVAMLAGASVLMKTLSR